MEWKVFQRLFGFQPANPSGGISLSACRSLPSASSPWAQHRALLKDSQGKFSPPHLSVMARNADRKEEAGKRENEEKGEEGEHLCTLSWHSNVVDGLY